MERKIVEKEFYGLKGVEEAKSIFGEKSSNFLNFQKINRVSLQNQI